MVDEKFLLCKPGVYIEKHGVLVETDLGRKFEINLYVHKLSAVNLEKGQFALVSVINHGFKLFKVSGKKIPKIP